MEDLLAEELLKGSLADTEVVEIRVKEDKPSWLYHKANTPRKRVLFPFKHHICLTARGQLRKDIL